MTFPQRPRPSGLPPGPLSAEGPTAGSQPLCWWGPGSGPEVAVRRLQFPSPATPAPPLSPRRRGAAAHRLGRGDPRPSRRYAAPPLYQRPPNARPRPAGFAAQVGLRRGAARRVGCSAGRGSGAGYVPGPRRAPGGERGSHQHHLCVPSPAASACNPPGRAVCRALECEPQKFLHYKFRVQTTSQRDAEFQEHEKILSPDFLSIAQITEMLAEDVDGVQRKLEKFLNFKNIQTCLKEAILLDYYVSGFLWAKGMEFSVIQSLKFMTLLDMLLHNLRKRC
nr:translation initiation factor IF-2-like [Manis javanica]